MKKPRGIIDHAGEPCSNSAVSQPLHTGYSYFRSFKVASRRTIITPHKHFSHQRNSVPVSVISDLGILSSVA